MVNGESKASACVMDVAIPLTHLCPVWRPAVQVSMWKPWRIWGLITTLPASAHGETCRPGSVTRAEKYGKEECLLLPMYVYSVCKMDGLDSVVN